MIVDELGKLDQRHVSCRILPKGAFYAWANIQETGMASRDLERHLLENAGVACVSGTSFGALGEGYVRFSYANSVNNIREGVRRIRECLHQPV